MKKVLIIEDDTTVAHIYQRRLAREGYQVEVANDGQSGFYTIQEFIPDVVLMDLMLPKMNGLEILKKIRVLSQFAQLPIVVFTNAYVPNMVNDSFQAGASEVFNKATVTPRQIVSAIQKALYCKGDKKPDDKAGQGETDTDTGTEDLEGEALAQAMGQPKLEILPPPEPEPAIDREFQAELLKAFGQTAPETMAALRRCIQEVIKAHSEEARLPHLLTLYRRVHALTSSAGIAGLRNIAHMAAALEVLLKELYEKPKNINPSTLRTMAHSIDFLGELFGRGNDADLLESKPVKILVVDDEILSRRAITYALEKADLKSVSVEDGHMALNLAQKEAFDLIFLDVQMPGMDGFELCTKVRSLDANRNTSVVFVTSLTDFKSRARSSLSGGNDLIAKPFMFIELSVKALTYVMRGRLAALRMLEAA